MLIVLSKYSTNSTDGPVYNMATVRSLITNFTCTNTDRNRSTKQFASIPVIIFTFIFLVYTATHDDHMKPSSSKSHMLSILFLYFYNGIPHTLLLCLS
jgi:hypothetical protein